MIEVVEADITTLEVDAVVNAANEQLAPGGGVSGAIHRAAGPELALACRKVAPCPPGEAQITPGFRLRARFVIHAVGPVWRGGGHGEPALLQAAYRSALDLAQAEPAIRSVAFPAISTGIYGFPRDEAAAIAIAVFRERETALDRIVACLFDEASTALYRRRLA
jgi:O-acetyl-ADP-ribose deacetylase